MLIIETSQKLWPWSKDAHMDWIYASNYFCLLLSKLNLFDVLKAIHVIVNLSLVMRKPAFCICEKTKPQISCAVTAQLISAFVFATQIVQSLFFLNPKFQASSHLLWLYSPVCVGNPEDRFSHNEARFMLYC